MKTWILGLLIGASAFGVYNVGDKPSNECWDALHVTPRPCLYDELKDGNVTVLIHNAGWCQPCNREFRELVPLVEKFQGKKVTFVSLSAEGWRHGSQPDTAFLQSWETKWGIDKAKAQWLVAGSYRDAGPAYFPRPSIPNVAIIDASGTLVFKGIGTSPREVVRQVEKVLK